MATVSGVEVVREVSFALNPGEILGLVGESGSGKTTVALALSGHTRRGLHIADGKVSLGNDDITSMLPQQLRQVRGRRIAYVAQDPASALNPALKVGRQLAEVLRAHAGALGRQGRDERMAEVIRDVRLDRGRDVLGAYPHQLSGGQQQRVMLALAFACRPEVIVLDEPTTGLDVTTQRHVLDTVRNLCEAYGVSAVYVSHDLAVVGELVGMVGVMYAGRMVEYGPTDDVFSAPCHPYTRGLLRAAPSPKRARLLEGISGQPPRPGQWPQGCAFAPRCGIAVPQCTVTFPPITPCPGPGHMARCYRADFVPAGAAPILHLDRTQRDEGDSVPALRVTKLVAAYGSTIVVKNASFDVRRRECLAIVGESGSGKTTLARCIVGLHTDWSGDLQFEGAAIPHGVSKRPLAQLRAMQYVFQNPYASLNPRRTVGQSLEQPLRHFFPLRSAERRRRIEAALSDAALTSRFTDRYPGELSGGERQRVAIARALVVEPELLICDEVTAALDVSVQAEIMELLRRLQTEHGLAVMFITHNLALVRSVAQRVIVLREGEVVESGETTRLLDAPQDDYTIRLLDDAPKLEVSAGAL